MNTGPSPKIRGVVMVRDAGHCLRCGAIGEQIHHRKPRGMGGTSDPAINLPSNLVLLCANCHREVESYRQAGYETGWLVARAKDPAEQYLLDLGGHMIMLTETGEAITDDLIPLPDCPSPFKDVS